MPVHKIQGGGYQYGKNQECSGLSHMLNPGLIIRLENYYSVIPELIAKSK